jgi:hypothetical protein
METYLIAFFFQFAVLVNVLQFCSDLCQLKGKATVFPLKTVLFWSIGCYTNRSFKSAKNNNPRALPLSCSFIQKEEEKKRRKSGPNSFRPTQPI